MSDKPSELGVALFAGVLSALTGASFGVWHDSVAAGIWMSFIYFASVMTARDVTNALQRRR